MKTGYGHKKGSSAKSPTFDNLNPQFRYIKCKITNGMGFKPNQVKIQTYNSDSGLVWPSSSRCQITIRHRRVHVQIPADPKIALVPRQTLLA